MFAQWLGSEMEDEEKEEKRIIDRDKTLEQALIVRTFVKSSPLRYTRTLCVHCLSSCFHIHAR